jgi:uncharacterized protein with HEPN domain
MEKDDFVYVGHMLDMSRKALDLVQGRSREEFERNEALALALTHLLQVIGEAARKVSKPFAEQNPGIPWRAIIGMRHKVVHDYLYVDRDIVWDVATKNLEPLAAELDKILRQV